MLTKTRPKERFLIAVSGGSDSMFLLDKYKNKDIIVVHVNYNLRPQAIFETLLVSKFCQKYNLMLKILSFDSFSVSGNLQANLRKVRYEFFYRIYKHFKCTKLLVAHHWNDFVETIFLQKEQKKLVTFWGIRGQNFLFGMQISRPLLYFYTKKRILNSCKKRKIPYLDDDSNFTDKYRRNAIRFKLQKLSTFSLFFTFSVHFIANFFKLIELKKNYKTLEKWKKTEYHAYFFQKIRKKPKIIFLYLHQNFDNIKLSKGKINSIIDFISSKAPNGSFLIKKNNYIIKKKLKIYAKSSKI
ncbi:tRNA lysidine(34) synthetase TilS [Mesomycoplasma ovipneumoniae]|uniref:tRNA lysidine(34) synthetase TilS n=1 Tax=Mesomycoplasma ovipneumoniae TaxID=29562 RepID=UPI00311C8A3F